MRHEPREGRTRVFPKDDPREDEQRAHDALLEWARWCVERRSPGRCRSIESRYDPRADGDKGAEFRLRLRPRVVRRPINQLLAERVNVSMNALPPEYRQALELRYYRALDDQAMCRVTCMRPEQYHTLMRSARLALDAIVFPQKEKAA